MDLRTWLFFNKKQIKDVAAALELSTSHLSNYMHGRVRISKKVAKQIQNYTNGDLTIDSLLSFNPQRSYNAQYEKKTDGQEIQKESKV